MQPLRGKWTNNQTGLGWAPSRGRNPTRKSTLLSHVAARWLLWVVLLHNQPPVERLTCYWRQCPLSSHICTNFWLLIVFQGCGSLGCCLTTFTGHTMGTLSQHWGTGKNNAGEGGTLQQLWLLRSYVDSWVLFFLPFLKICFFVVVVLGLTWGSSG